MDSCSFLSPTRLVIGRDSVEKAPELIKSYGGTCVLVACDSFIKEKTGLLTKVMDLLTEAGLKAVEFSGIVPNPDIEQVYEGIDLCRKEGVDFLLPIGGGAVIDTCKAIAMGLPYDGDVWDFFIKHEDGYHWPTKSTPIGVILTISATGSEASNSCVISKSSENLKRFCDVDISRPVFAIENPELTMTLPPYQTACGCMDIMSHSLERYFTPQTENMELTDRLCEAIFHTCLYCGRILKNDPTNYDARASIMVAGTLSHNDLTGIGRQGDWATHPIEHELSGEFGVTHGAGIAVITLAWMKYVYKEQRNIFLKWATRVMGVPMDFENPDNTIEQAIQALEDWIRYIGLPTRLQELKGVTEEALTDEVLWKMAKRVRSGREDGSVGQVKKIFPEDTVKIFKIAMEK